MNTLANYPGGKNGSGVYQAIINQIPPHEHYIEAFLGHGAILRRKKPARSTTAIDADADAIGAWTGEEIPALHLIQTDAIQWLKENTFSRETFIYLDPPYLMATRSSKRPLYAYEMTDDDHARLLDVIKELDAMVMISGYESELYNYELQNWRVATFTGQSRARVKPTEFIWMNYNQPIELHDYSYLGDGYRERERIERKRKRWRNRFDC